MTKSGSIRARIEPELKAKAEDVFGKLGLTPGEAIRLFYAEVARDEKLPFEARVPNAASRRALKDIKEGRNLKEYKDADEMFKALGL
jgi:DNA-damage-inducible protein J